VDWYQGLTEVIDMRSFSNLWFWIALAVVWSSASHWVLGVPFDMVSRARRHGGQAEQDLHDIMRINVNRLLLIASISGVFLIGIVSFVLSTLAVLGWIYDVEFAQAVFLLACPMTAIGALSVRTALRIAQTDPTGEALRRALTRHRFVTQAIGTVAIFFTAVWGMISNLSISGLGG